VGEIRYVIDVSLISADQLAGGFWQGWPTRPTPEAHLAALRGSDFAVVAIDDETGEAVGFISAIADGVLAAFIPLLEVRPEYRRQGIATELVRRVLAHYGDHYSIDLVCDEELVPFYERFGGMRLTAIAWRNRTAIASANTVAGLPDN
jgi:ribosomal protein S18 acetylase RimI-like enzyme